MRLVLECVQEVKGEENTTHGNGETLKGDEARRRDKEDGVVRDKEVMNETEEWIGRKRRGREGGEIGKRRRRRRSTQVSFYMAASLPTRVYHKDLQN